MRTLKQLVEELDLKPSDQEAFFGRDMKKNGFS